MFPKWKYRKHPDLGFFQSTLVAHAEAEKELGKDWSDDPKNTGFEVRPAAQLHPSHVVAGHHEGNILHEVVYDFNHAPTEATIDLILKGDLHA